MVLYYAQDDRRSCGQRQGREEQVGMRLAKGRAVVLGEPAHLTRMGLEKLGQGKTAMKMIAYLLAIISAIAAVMYFVMPAGQLPTFVPGYLAGSDHIHTTHGIAAVVAAVVLLGIGKFAGRG
jgi:hypothetical protein